MELDKEQIKKRLHDKGYTFQKVADYANVDRAFITNLTAGIRKSQRVLNIIRLILNDSSVTIKENKTRRKVNNRFVPNANQFTEIK